MQETKTHSGIAIRASDVSGQKIVNIPNTSPDETVGELLKVLVSKLNLPENEPYQIHLQREGRHLNASERVADALQSGDQIVLQPNISAGGN